MVAIIDFGSKKTPEIESLIKGLGYSCSVFANHQEIEFSSCKAIVLSGSPVLWTETDVSVYLKKFSWLKTIEIPVLGICFGHQLIGLLFGANVFKGIENRAETTITIFEKDPLFEGVDFHSTFMEDHTEGITLPSDFFLLATSSDYEVEAMRHKQKKIYGVQFHPEISGDNGKKIIQNFLNKIK